MGRSLKMTVGFTGGLFCRIVALSFWERCLARLPTFLRLVSVYMLTATGSQCPVAPFNPATHGCY